MPFDAKVEQFFMCGVLHVSTMCLLAFAVCDTRILYLTAFFLTYIFFILCVHVSSFHLLLAVVYINLSLMCLGLPHEVGSRRTNANTGHFCIHPPIPPRSLHSFHLARRVSNPVTPIVFYLEYIFFPAILGNFIFSLRRDSNTQSRESRVAKFTTEPLWPPCSVGI